MLRILFSILFVFTVLPSLGIAQSGDSGPPGRWYKIESLNDGLGAPPAEIDRATPQGAIESFLDSADRGDFSVAAHILNLNAFEQSEQAERGATLARHLYSVLDRQAIISWRTLLERPDALNANAASENAMAGEPRRSLLIGVLDLSSRETAIRLSRVKPGDDEPVWVFSQRTVEMIPPLYEEYGPSRYEKALPEWAKREEIWGLSLWEIAGLPLLLLITAAFGWAAFRILGMLSRGTPGRWRREIFYALKWPAVLAITVTVLSVAGQRLFVLSGTVATMLEPLVVGGYAFAILLFSLHLIDVVMERVTTFDPNELMASERGTSRSTATFLSGLRRGLIVAFFLITTASILHATNLFRTLGFSLFASAGVLTLIFGFAARHVLGNIIASLQIALNKSARIGDQVYFEDQWCTVEKIHFTYVQLMRWDRVRLVVPVAEFVGDTFINLTQGEPAMTRRIVLTFANEFDIAPMRNVFLDLVEEREDIIEKDSAAALVISQDAIGQQVRFQFNAPDPSTGWIAECELREALIAAARQRSETGDSAFPEGAVDMGGA